MPQCISLTHSVQRCRRNAVIERRCRAHHELHQARIAGAGPPPVNRCQVFTQGDWCGRDTQPGWQLCRQHHEQQIEGIRQEFITAEVLEFIDAGYTWQEVLEQVREENAYNETMQRQVVEQVYANEHNGQIEGWVIDLQWNRIRAVNDNIANDPQNVHRTPVSNQTNKITDLLLAEVISPVQDTERYIAQAWFGLPPQNRPEFSEYLRVANDMHQWYTTETCRTINDWLYKKILDGLVAYIEYQPSEVRKELYIRLYQEAYESINMCCEGHISRLCNTVVGFIEGVNPPISIGEVLQMKMAAIAQKDASPEAKRAEAEEVLREYSIEGDLRDGWLNAF